MHHNKKVSPGSWQLEKSLCGNEDAMLLSHVSRVQLCATP